MWDLRTYKEMHSYFTKTPPTDMDISHRGLLSLSFGCHVQVSTGSVPMRDGDWLEGEWSSPSIRDHSSGHLCDVSVVLPSRDRDYGVDHVDTPPTVAMIPGSVEV